MPPTTERSLPALPGVSLSRAYGLSVDVEDYYHVEAFADRITPEMWPNFPRRVAENTRRVLELFDRAGARATFLVLGWVAEREPQLVREIAAAGHELGCHSYLHQPVWRLTPDQFREDTRRAVSAIQDATGHKVIGYRAPTFSIVRKSLWALELLAEEGFVYDSSVFPIHHDLYGMPEAPRFTFRWQCGGGRSIFEIPMTTVRLWGWNLPAAGGGYLRILPMAYTRWALDRNRKRHGEPSVVYFHPWEIDPGQPRLSGKRKSVFRHYFNLNKMEERIGGLLRGRRFVALQDYLQNRLAGGPLPTRTLATTPIESSTP